jgi:hypothetical protein
MAERYPPGRHRIFYRSTSFQEGLIVTVRMLNPDDVWLDEVTLEDMGSGLYRLGIQFDKEGTWVGLFSENGMKKLTQNFLVMRERPRNLGSNMLNG